MVTCAVQTVRPHQRESLSRNQWLAGPKALVSFKTLKIANRASSWDVVVLYVMRQAGQSFSFSGFITTSYRPAPDAPWWGTSCRRLCWQSDRWAPPTGWRIASEFGGSAWRPRRLHGHDRPLMPPGGPARGRSRTGPTNGTRPRSRRNLVKQWKIMKLEVVCSDGFRELQIYVRLSHTFAVAFKFKGVGGQRVQLKMVYGINRSALTHPAQTTQGSALHSGHSKWTASQTASSGHHLIQTWWRKHLVSPLYDNV